ncbi:MAG: succinate dehydrogenase/fumarate reductase iron-sulfur subunit [Bacteroidetes bacterium 38_7]|nr:MAG: succinate dehydrogenase/fumarate reductase iron-sulfur subunit [Bacteroidetes bacterium 38_7]HAL64494.1 succinate dehydrogenase/fumarate reductase iron-sulfur subunit [Bacteroidales bacterium]
MKLTLKIWRQNSPKEKGAFKTYILDDASQDMTFLEMLDALNEKLIAKNEDPVAFDHDCREGICGSCGMIINGRPHGPGKEITTCQLNMKAFKDGDTIVIEPWRAKPFPVIKDLIVDRSAFDKIMEAGGFVNTDVGSAPEANTYPIKTHKAEEAFEAASCIGCGACVAACKNSSAMLFVAAKVSQYALLPQGKVESLQRAWNMIMKMDELGFGSCTNTGACEAECPKGISLAHIARLNNEFIKSGFNKLFADKH